MLIEQLCMQMYKESTCIGCTSLTARKCNQTGAQQISKIVVNETATTLDFAFAITLTAGDPSQSYQSFAVCIVPDVDEGEQ